jgi:putative tryptophan/tyrosine transport system substrate-binding protein
MAQIHCRDQCRDLAAGGPGAAAGGGGFSGGGVRRVNGLLEIGFAYQQNKASLIRIQREQAKAAAAKIGQFIKEIESQVGWTVQVPWSFIAGLGGTAAWPFAARAQQAEAERRIGVLMPSREDEAFQRAPVDAFTRRLAELGWNSGRNVRIDVRYAPLNDLDLVSRSAKELVGLRPDAIFVSGGPLTAALQRETRTVPIIFILVSDPIGLGFVASMPHPGGNLTGFSNQDPTLGGKWVELLTEIAPGRMRIAALFNPDTAPSVRSYYIPSFEAAARYFNIEPVVAPVHSEAEIGTVFASFGREPGGGIVVMPDGFAIDRRAFIIQLATRYKLPTIYQRSIFPKDGGLLSYGPSFEEVNDCATAYMDRILRGAKPADLPVQLPVKFEMVVNANTAKAIGLTVPPSILLRADEVIE